MGRKLEATLAVLNGAIGDYLARTGNGLATETVILPAIGAEHPLRLEHRALEKALPGASARVALLVPGLMCTETIWEMADGSDYGARLARDLGYTPVYLRYNSGLAIAENGARLSAALEAFAAEYPRPLEEIVPIGYSMGGLVVRSACHVARLERKPWLPLVRRAIYVGTPHLGAPLERVGRTVAKLLRAIEDPYTRLVGELADLRSDGLKDLGDADLRHEDRAPKAPRLRLRDPQHPVPLLPEIQHHLVAGSLADDTFPATLAALFGDALVPVHSATAGLGGAPAEPLADGDLAGRPRDRDSPRMRAVDPTSDVLRPSHVKILGGLSHIMLAHDPEVYGVIRGWCE